jgi:hypothetical protein
LSDLLKASELIQKLQQLNPSNPLIFVRIFTAQDEANPGIPYPILDEAGAEIIPNDACEVDEADPSTYVHERKPENGQVETVVVYWVDEDYSLDQLKLWAEALQADVGYHRGWITRVEVDPLPKLVAN